MYALLVVVHCVVEVVVENNVSYVGVVSLGPLIGALLCVVIGGSHRKHIRMTHKFTVSPVLCLFMSCVGDIPEAEMKGKEWAEVCEGNSAIPIRPRIVRTRAVMQDSVPGHSQEICASCPACRP